MRGKDNTRYCPAYRPGITPAYAGKSARTLTGNTAYQDHPRVCGEKAEAGTGKNHRLGSPPRMRGKAKPNPVMLSAIRITPAYAGKRNSLYLISFGGKDHPRVCGEKQPQRRRVRRLLGSPPRMRGKVERLLKMDPQNGITPAYAGKSF